MSTFRLTKTFCFIWFWSFVFHMKWRTCIKCLRKWSKENLDLRELRWREDGVNFLMRSFSNCNTFLQDCDDGMPYGIICCLDFSVVRVKTKLRTLCFGDRVNPLPQVGSKTPTRSQYVNLWAWSTWNVVFLMFWDDTNLRCSLTDIFFTPNSRTQGAVQYKVGCRFRPIKPSLGLY